MGRGSDSPLASAPSRSGDTGDGPRCAGSHPRCAVVTTTCVAPGIDILVWWARYHICLGVDTIYLYIHDARSVGAPAKRASSSSGAREPTGLLDAVQRALAANGLDRAVLALPALVAPPRKSEPGGGFVDVVALQERNATDAVRRGRAQGMDWLFHFDDDELLSLTTPRARGAEALGDVVRAARSGSFNLRVDNVEVQRSMDAIDSRYNFFEVERRFKLRVGLHADGAAVPRHHDPRYYTHGGNPASGADGLTAPYLSYWNGKSCGRLAEPGLRPCGVHFFAAARGDAVKNDAQDRAVGLVLLHYPFCHFLTWRHKFNVLDATQRSDWGHYRDARLAIVDACAPGGGGEKQIEAFYRKAIMLRDSADPEAPDPRDHVALYLPPVAAPQHWRSGIYERSRADPPLCAGACYRRLEASGPRDVDPPPPSFLYRVPEKKMWLVGSSPGATTGAAVVYDDAERPESIGATWCVYDGAGWVKARAAAVAAVAYDGGGRRYGVVDPRYVLAGSDAAAPAVDRARTALERGDGSSTGGGPAVDGGDDAAAGATARERSGPDHAKLASVVLAALDAHAPYEENFWVAVAAAAAREPPGLAVDDAAARRALAAGARAMGTTGVAASLVAERLASSSAASKRVRDCVRDANASRVKALDAHGKDAIILSIPGAEGVQSWRAGLYAREPKGASDAVENGLLYKRVRERPADQDSFLYTLPARGMWLVGSTPGSTTGGLVSYDRAARLRDLSSPWHVFDGKTWAQAAGIRVTVVEPGKKKAV